MKKKLISIMLTTSIVMSTLISGTLMVSADGIARSRISGANRFETAMNVADEIKTELGGDNFSTIIVANSDNFADALSATALASKHKAPILVVNESNEAKIKGYIAKNVERGGKVYLIGGTGAVSRGFEESLSGYSVERLGGADRFETNLKVLEELNLNQTSNIVVASGLEYADALSASASGRPIVLVGKTLTTEQINFFKSIGRYDTCYIIGGKAAVNEP